MLYIIYKIYSPSRRVFDTLHMKQECSLYLRFIYENRHVRCNANVMYMNLEPK